MAAPKTSYGLEYLGREGGTNTSFLLPERFASFDAAWIRGTEADENWLSCAVVRFEPNGIAYKAAATVWHRTFTHTQLPKPQL